MKHVIITLTLLPFFAMAQNVGIGTDIPAGKLHIKGTEDTTQLLIEANSIQSNNHPLLLFTKGTIPILSLHSDAASNVFLGLSSGKSNVPGSGANNTLIGSGAGRSNTTGSSNTALGYGTIFNNATGYSLIAIGVNALTSNTSGFSNIAIGGNALGANRTKSGSIAIGINALANTDNSLTGGTTRNIALGTNALKGSLSPTNNIGTSNIAIGENALFSFSGGGNNTAVGVNSLYYNSGGQYNSGMGVQTLYNNTTGIYNSAMGINALYNNIGNSYNTGIGYNALFSTTASDYNTALGSQAGDSYNNGFNNVFLGANADVNGAGYYNVIAIGQGTVVGGVSTARFGNAATASYGGWAGWTNVSDGRFKSNVQENVPGLAFISKLRPVTYNLDATRLDAFLHKNDSPEKLAIAAKNSSHLQALQEKEQIIYTGFIAQEVEKSAKELGFDFSGVDKARNENDTYGLRYAEFVVPLVKAVQELDAENSLLKKQLDTIGKQYEELKRMVVSLSEGKK
ncbi:MAG: tail fiber domain-containing protein [Ferruginibacter sp.]